MSSTDTYKCICIYFLREWTVLHHISLHPSEKWGKNSHSLQRHGSGWATAPLIPNPLHYPQRKRAWQIGSYTRLDGEEQVYSHSVLPLIWLLDPVVFPGNCLPGRRRGSSFMSFLRQLPYIRGGKSGVNIVWSRCPSELLLPVSGSKRCFHNHTPSICGNNVAMQGGPGELLFLNSVCEIKTTAFDNCEI